MSWIGTPSVIQTTNSKLESICSIIASLANGAGTKIMPVFAPVSLIALETDEKYGNLFDMYKQITGQNPYENPMMIYPAVHYTMGGLWVDYNLMTSIPGLFAIGEANCSVHGANRLGANGLLQCLTDGYSILPYSITKWLDNQK